MSASSWAACYGAMATVRVVAALSFLLVPAQVATRVYGAAAEPVDAQHSQMLHLNAGAMLVGAAAAAAVALSGRSGGGLGARNTDLLKLAMAGQGVAVTLCVIYYCRTITRSLLPLELATAALLAALPAADLVTGGRRRGLLDELSSRLCAAPRTSPLALALHGLAWLFPLVGLLLVYFPHFTMFHLFGYAYGSSTFLLARVAGVADKSLIPDATESGALRTRAAKVLSAGLMLAGVVHMRVLLPLLAKGRGGWVLPIAASTWVAAFLAATVALLAGLDKRGSTTGPAGGGMAGRGGAGDEVVGEKKD
ncbi:hypothetical protein ACK3TF_001211 [Chlorella vulgaris]